jgi:uncharacterized membrane protein HdeD (DUF308 family)
MLFIVGGIFRIVAAVTSRFEGWGLLILVGVLDQVMGGIIVANWPVSGLWVLGLFLGIDLIFNGAWFVSLALGARRVCKATASPTTPPPAPTAG